MPYNISLFVSDGVVSVHWKLSVSTEIVGTQFLVVCNFGDFDF